MSTPLASPSLPIRPPTPIYYNPDTLLDTLRRCSSPDLFLPPANSSDVFTMMSSDLDSFPEPPAYLFIRSVSAAPVCFVLTCCLSSISLIFFSPPHHPPHLSPSPLCPPVTCMFYHSYIYLSFHICFFSPYLEDSRVSFQPTFTKPLMARVLATCCCQ